MKKLQILFLVSAFFVVGASNTFAGDLIGTMPYIPSSQDREYRPQFDSEQRYTYGGAAAGLGLSSLATENSTVRVAATIFGAMVGNEWGAARRRKEVAYENSRPRDNCEVIVASRTNPQTGQNEAQHAQYCREKFRANIPHADMPAPTTMSYKHDGSRAVDPLAGLSPEDRKAVEESRAQRQGVVLSGEERAVLEEYRKFKAGKGTGSTPTPHTDEMAFPSTVSYTPGCQRYVHGKTNPNC